MYDPLYSLGYHRVARAAELDPPSQLDADNRMGFAWRYLKIMNCFSWVVGVASQPKPGSELANMNMDDAFWLAILLFPEINTCNLDGELG